MKSNPVNRSAGYSPLDDFERQFVRPREGRTLIVGSRVYNDKPDRRKLYRDVLGVDMLHGPGVDEIVDMGVDYDEDEINALDRIGVFAHVECLSVLEHCERPWLMGHCIERVMQPGSTIFVSVPFVFRPHAYPDDHWRVSASAIPIIFPRIEWKAIRYISNVLHEQDARKLPVIKQGNHPYIARTETVAFGVRR